MFALLLVLAVAAEPQAKAPAPKPLPPGQLMVQLDTLHCPSCAKQISRNLYRTPGVMRVRADLKKDQIWITAQPKKQLDLARVWQATQLKDAKPVELRIGARTFVAKDFEKKKEEVAAKGSTQRR